MNEFAGIRPKGVKTRPPSFFPWRLQWGLSVFQWGSNPHNPPPIFTLGYTVPIYPSCSIQLSSCYTVLHSFVNNGLADKTSTEPGLHLSHRRVALRYPVLSRQMSPPAIPYMTVHKTIIFDRQHYWRSKPMRHFFA